MYNALRQARLPDDSIILGQIRDNRSPLCLCSLGCMILRNVDFEIIKAAIQDGQALATRQPNEAFPVQLACHRGNFELAFYMAQVGPKRDVDMDPEHTLWHMGPVFGHNAAVWYGMLSNKSGFWIEGKTASLIQFLKFHVEQGFDVNMATMNEAEAPLIHLAMLPHVNSSVTEALMDLGADPMQYAPIDPLVYYNQVYLNCSHAHILERPCSRRSRGVTPLESLLMQLDGQDFDRVRGH